jgi:hypothetical protein
MNDLEQELRELLRHKADEAWPRPEAPVHVIRRARRRQVATSLLAGLTAVLVGVGSFVGVRALGSNRSVPAEPQLVTDTVNGITISYPDDWFAGDPVALGIEPEPDPGEPRLVLLLSKHDPSIPGLFGCPGQAKDRAPGEVLMTVQEQVPIVGGEHNFVPWPAALEEVFEGDPITAGCYGGWTFYRAMFTSEGRFFQANVGVAPDATSADRQAMFDAFASMRFTSVSAVEGSSAVIATGTAAGEDWQLVAWRHEEGQLVLQLETEQALTGVDFPELEGDIHVATHTGFGDRTEVVVFGAVSDRVAEVRVILFGAADADILEVLPIPDEIDPRLDAFVTVVPNGAVGEVQALDDGGAIVDRRFLTTPAPVSGEVPGRILIPSGIVLTSGTSAGREWTLSASRRTDILALELLHVDGPTILESRSPQPAIVFTFEEFGEEDVEVVLFGVVSERVARVLLRGPDGSEVEAEILAIPGDVGVEGVDAFVLLAPRPLTGSRVVALDASGNELEVLPVYSTD